MRMPHHVYGDRRFRARLFKLALQGFERAVYRFIEAIRIPVDSVERVVQRADQEVFVRVRVIEEIHGFVNCLGKVIEFVRRGVQIADVRLLNAMAEFALYAAALEPRPQHERKRYGLSLERFKIHVVVIRVHALERVAVHIQERFKAAVVTAAGLAEIEQTVNLESVAVRGQGDRLLRPEIAIAPDELIADRELTAFNLLRHSVINLVHAKLTGHRRHRRDGLHRNEPEVFKLPAALLQTLLRQKHIVVAHWGCPPFLIRDH